jgi:NADH-quinone oxidoreductase subunit N
MKSLLIIFLGAIAVLFFGIKRPERKSLPIALLVLIAALVFIPLDWIAFIHKHVPDWQIKYVPTNMLSWDTPALAFSGVLILAAIFVLGLFSKNNLHGADLLGLMLFSVCGGLLMTSFSNLIMLFLGIECLSIPLYVLAGSRKSDLGSNEAAVKYFLLGSFSTAVFLLGCAFIYGGTGSLDLDSLARATNMLGHMGIKSQLVMAGLLILMVGMFFKIAAFPFHFWSPDVYDGSPNRATVFMATVAKIAAFAAFFRLFHYAFNDIKGWWAMTIAVVSAATILFGNIAALRQQSMKRTLAYSSVAHAGYMLMAILASPFDGFWALLVYLVAYAFSSLSIFFLLDRTSNGNEGFSFDNFNGFGRANKFGSLVLVIGLFSMAGIPLTAGFAGKFGLFNSIIGTYPWLLVIALLGSAISIAYYFKVFKNAFFGGEQQGTKLELNLMDTVMLGLAVLVILTVGIWPTVITGLQIIPAP